MTVGAVSAHGIVVAGHGAASGTGSARYPEGTLGLQIPIFAELGLDLRDAFPGTINVDTDPLTFVPGSPDRTFSDVAWSEAIPPETFSFFRCTIVVGDAAHPGWVYRPHPETKVEHTQPATVCECLATHIPGITVGIGVVVRLADGRGVFR